MEETIVLIENEEIEHIISEPYIEQINPTTQEKTITPSQNQQIVEPDEGVFALSKVTVEPIPEEYIKPTGTLEISANGEYDVGTYKKANVNIPDEADNYFGAITQTLATSDVATIFSRFIKELPEVDLSSSPITSLKSAFRNLYDCIKIGKITAPNGITNTSYMCHSNRTLKVIDISGIDTSGVTNMSYFFFDNYELVEIIGEIDMTSTTNTNAILTNDNKLTTVKIKNLGVNLDLSNTKGLSAESIDYLLCNVKDVSASSATITLGTTNLSKASEDAITHATSLGWTVN